MDNKLAEIRSGFHKIFVKNKECIGIKVLAEDGSFYYVKATNLIHFYEKKHPFRFIINCIKNKKTNERNRIVGENYKEYKRYWECREKFHREFDSVRNKRLSDYFKYIF